MRARLQKSNILVPPKYEKNLSSVLIYDDNDQVIFAVTMTPAGTYKFSHIGLDDFKQEIKAITGMTIDNPKLEEIG
jgi:hypothetical protein